MSMANGMSPKSVGENRGADGEGSVAQSNTPFDCKLERNGLMKSSELDDEVFAVLSLGLVKAWSLSSGTPIQSGNELDDSSALELSVELCAMLTGPRELEKHKQTSEQRETVLDVDEGHGSEQ